MRTVALFAAVVAAPLMAADPPKPNALTPQEAADGWVSLFDGETTFGWQVQADAGVAPGMTAADGVLTLKGAAGTLATAVRVRDFDLRGEFRAIGQPCSFATKMGSGGAASMSAGGPLEVLDGGWKPIRCRSTRERFVIAANDKDYVSMGGSVTAQMDGCELAFTLPGPAATLELRNLKLRPLGLKRLFTGKDLAGWKPFPGDKYKSQFAVTPAGELHITNGPGDLQTEANYSDFVLQLDCKTQGKGLNSGVFFRCLPGQYQQGYEAQIQNTYVGTDRTKPIDYGTGAIYRRVPARRVVSDDNEWFTMTVLANGPHLATWVNGYPTVNWTDDRKPDDNPRKGLRLAAGHLSLQGHDPSTDLLFRNIRVGVMK